MEERGPLVREFERKTTVSRSGQENVLDKIGGTVLKILEAKSDVGENQRRIWSQEVKGLPQIQSMNLETLCRALIILRQVGDETDYPTIIRTIGVPGEDLASISQSEYTLQLARSQEIFRYCRAILNYRTRNYLETIEN